MSALGFAVSFLSSCIQQDEWKYAVMSGGSYNYLMSAIDLEDLLSKRYHLKSMAERLEGLSEEEFPGVTAAARATRELLILVNMWDTHAGTAVKVLSDVWRSVEWWDSCDSGPKNVREELDKLLKRKPNV